MSRFPAWSTPGRPRSRRAKVRAALCLLLVLFLGYGIYTGVRFNILLQSARRLTKKNDSFPRRYFVGAANRPQFLYVVLGDSTSAGVGAGRLQESYPYQVAEAVAARGYYVRVVNLAVSGAQLQHVLQDQLPQLDALNPQLITVSAGANDAMHGTPPTRFEQELSTLVSRLRRTRAVVLMGSTPDVFQAPALPLGFALVVERRTLRQNQVLRRLIASTSIQAVDLYGRGKLVAQKNPVLYAEDFFHPAPRGYAIWSRLFIEKLKSQPLQKSTPN